MEKILSAATKRAIARGDYEKDDEWFTNFRYTPITGDLVYEKGIMRRDPSSVLLVDGIYYVWYTKSTTDSITTRYYHDQIWYATSTDGYDWKERGCAVTYGAEDEYDGASVLTTEVLHYDGKFYLSYQCGGGDEYNKAHPLINSSVGMSVATSPDGPWEKLPDSILKSASNFVMDGDKVIDKGDFDTLAVHDPSIHPFKGKFYLYYKGEPVGQEMFIGGREPKWGVAIADEVTGPYIRSPYNPVTNSGHETCMWEYDGGIAGMVTSDGMERNTFQYAKDGVNFEIVGTFGRLEHPPHAAGPFRPKQEDIKVPLDGITWGLCIADSPDQWDFMQRFDIENGMKEMFGNYSLKNKKKIVDSEPNYQS